MFVCMSCAYTLDVALRYGPKTCIAHCISQCDRDIVSTIKCIYKHSLWIEAKRYAFAAFVRSRCIFYDAVSVRKILDAFAIHNSSSFAVFTHSYKHPSLVLLLSSSLSFVWPNDTSVSNDRWRRIQWWLVHDIRFAVDCVCWLGMWIACAGFVFSIFRFTRSFNEFLVFISSSSSFFSSLVQHSTPNVIVEGTSYMLDAPE